MTSERKIVSVRLPAVLVARVDFVARNIDSEAVTNRSAALHAALRAWLPAQEKRLAELGLIEKKAPKGA